MELIPSPILCRAHSLKPEISGSPGSKARHNLNALEDRVWPRAAIRWFVIAIAEKTSLPKGAHDRAARHEDDDE
jgi:hypothetical protein